VEKYTLSNQNKLICKNEIAKNRSSSKKRKYWKKNCNENVNSTHMGVLSIEHEKRIKIQNKKKLNQMNCFINFKCMKKIHTIIHVCYLLKKFYKPIRALYIFFESKYSRNHENKNQRKKHFLLISLITAILNFTFFFFYQMFSHT
jgi:hypothetical protein